MITVTKKIWLANIVWRIGVIIVSNERCCFDSHRFKRIIAILKVTALIRNNQDWLNIKLS